MSALPRKECNPNVYVRECEDEEQDGVRLVRAVAAPRLLLWRSGNRATMAKRILAKEHVAGLSVIEGEASEPT